MKKLMLALAVALISGLAVSSISAKAEKVQQEGGSCSTCHPHEHCMKCKKPHHECGCKKAKPTCTQMVAVEKPALVETVKTCESCCPEGYTEESRIPATCPGECDTLRCVKTTCETHTACQKNKILRDHAYSCPTGTVPTGATEVAAADKNMAYSGKQNAKATQRVAGARAKRASTDVMAVAEAA